jgi:hypothetical protein
VSAMKAAARVPGPTWRVTVNAHDIPPRWRIEAQNVKLTSPTAARARLRAIRWWHADGGVPPMKPLIRLSWPHTTAKQLTPGKPDSVTAFYPPPPPRQHDLWTGRRTA